MAVIDRLEIEVEMKDISSSTEIENELVEKGGKKQVPYLVDSERSVAMYESDDIVKHLQDNYGKNNTTATKPRIHVGDSTCVSCEG